MSENTLRRRGVTLVEMLIVVGILGIILAAAAPSIADIMARRRVEMVAAELATNLAYARSEAGVRPTDVLIYFGRSAAGTCYTVAQWGNRGDCDCTRGAGSACSGTGVNLTEIKTVLVPGSTGVSVASSVSPFTFTAPQMSVPAPSPVMSVRGRRVGQLQLDLNIVGRVAMCSPDGSVTGVARCAGT